MDDGKKISLAVSTCIIGLIIILCARVATTATKAAAQPPIPKVGPLAQPRSLKQVGLPAELTRTVIPPDNPQTPEKIALGQKFFSTVVCLLTEASPAPAATMRSAHS